VRARGLQSVQFFDLEVAERDVVLVVLDQDVAAGAGAETGVFLELAGLEV
jgi:hypothetical protein